VTIEGVSCRRGVVLQSIKMDIDDEGVTDPSAEFGDLFEGQTVAFESELGGDVLGDIGHELGHSSHHHHHHHIHHHGASTSHPSDHEILNSANLAFPPDEYLQHQQIVIEGNNSEYMVSVPDTDGGCQLVQEDGSGQHVYVQNVHLTQEQIMEGVVEACGSSAPLYNYETVTVDQPETARIREVPLVEEQKVEETVKVKKKVKRVKDVEYFTKENMKSYLKRRGFSRVHFPQFNHYEQLISNYILD